MRASLVLATLVSTLVLAQTASAQSRRPRLAGAGEVYVLIEGPKTATLEAADGDSFRTVCKAPCDLPFATGKTYRIAGDDVHPSEPFELHGDSGSTVVLQVDDSKHHTGSLVTQGGVIVTLVGGLMVVGGVFGSCAESNLGDACDTYRWLTVSGVVLAAAGVATIVGGIVLMAQGSRSNVVERILAPPRTPSAPKPQSSLFSELAADRSAGGPRLPAAASTPILSFSF